MERYVAEALAGRAEWAPLLAATELDLSEVVGNNMHLAGPSIGAIAGVVAKLVQAEIKKQKGTEVVVTRGEKRKAQPGAHESNVFQGVPGAKAREAPLPPTRTFVRSTRTGVGHAVRFCGEGLHAYQWETECGWKCGKAKHEACNADAVSCTRCKLALRG